MVESGSYDSLSLASFTLDCDSHCLQTPVIRLAEEDGSGSMLSVPHRLIRLVGWEETLEPATLALLGGKHLPMSSE